jgi:hypothetical protein
MTLGQIQTAFERSVFDLFGRADVPLSARPAQGHGADDVRVAAAARLHGMRRIRVPPLRSSDGVGIGAPDRRLDRRRVRRRQGCSASFCRLRRG